MGNREDREVLRERIRELIEFKGGGYNADLVEDLIEQSLKLLHDVEHRGDARIIQTAVRELRYAFHLFEPYASQRKVTIFGSARTSPDKVEYQQVIGPNPIRLIASFGEDNAGEQYLLGFEGKIYRLEAK